MFTIFGTWRFYARESFIFERNAELLMSFFVTLLLIFTIKKFGILPGGFPHWEFLYPTSPHSLTQASTTKSIKYIKYIMN